MAGRFCPVTEVQKLLGDDPALLFVDPTGWKGAAMKNVVPLMAGRYRDVIVNVMFNFINRFKADLRPFLRAQMQEFFGLDEADVPDVDEENLLRFYRQQLKDKCGLVVAADLAIPHPTQDRTWFRLVVGGKATKVLELFREVEHRVVGKEAGAVREQARRTTDESRTGQLTLGLAAPMKTDRRYDELHQRDRQRARETIVRLVAEKQPPVPMMFGTLWTELLQDHHLTRGEVGRIVMELHRAGQIIVRDVKPKQKVPQDNQVIKMP